MDEKRPGGLPPPLTPEKLLDSLLKEGGSLPAASLGIRLTAFAMDAVLIFAIASLIIWKFFLPAEYPEAISMTQAWQAEIASWMSAGDALSIDSMPQPSPVLAEALTKASEINFFLFWIYFAVGEAFFAGGSLGKRACRIRTISTVTLASPSIFSGITRGGMKTIALLAIPPFSVVATLLFLLFNKRKQMGHDILSRTAVVDERYIYEEEK